MGAKSKQKGGRGEREVCALLKETFDGSFIRSANSGAYVGGKNAVRKEELSEGQIMGLKGDIVPPDFMPRFVIECKLYKDFIYHGFVSGEPIAQLDAWIKQTLDCIDDGDFWVLTFRADRRPWAIAWEVDAKVNLPARHIRYISKEDKAYYVSNLKDFLVINRDTVLELTK